jgi:DNA-binding NtrC family response regulator
MALLCDGERIQLEHVPAEVRQVSAQPSAAELPRSWNEFKRLKRQVKEAAVNQLERRFLMDVLSRWEGNVSRAADAIGIQRTNLHALLRKHGLTAQLLRGEH